MNYRRQQQTESTAFAWASIDLNAAVMSFYNRFDYTKAESGAFLGCVGSTIETVEYVWKNFRGNARAAI